LIFLVFVNHGAIHSRTLKSNEAIYIDIDGREYKPAREPYSDGGRIYLAAEDIFGILRYDIHYSAASGISSFISCENFFTVAHSGFETRLNGVALNGISWRLLDGRLYIDVADLPKLSPVSVSIAYSNRYKIDIKNEFKKKIIVHNDDYLFSYNDSFMVSGGLVYIGIYDLPFFFPESVININDRGVEMINPNNTRAFFKFSGEIMLGFSSSVHTNPEVLYRDAPGSVNKIINLNHIAQYAGYKISLERLSDRYYIDIVSDWYGDKNYNEIKFENETIPLGTPAGIAYEPAGANRSVRDTGYILNTKMMNDLADGINKYRTDHGRTALAINHSLIYAAQSGADVLKNNGFDNLRWCRENLNGRELTHTTVAAGYYEIMVANAKNETPVARMINALQGSELHRDVMLNILVTEFGVAAVQYPNGDVDVACIFR